jgi:hypothetical protein
MRNKLGVVSVIALLLQPLLLIQDAAAWSNTVVIQNNDAKMRQILNDPVIWGPDFKDLLSAVKDVRESGETKIEVFPEEAVNATPYANLVAALKEASKLHGLMSVDSGVTPSAHPSKDDGTGRVVLISKNEAAPEKKKTVYLAPGLTMETVRERNGSPESVTTRLIDSGDERRPLILKLYSYAGGAIVFAESDVTPVRGAVERVILDVNKISGVLP